MRITVDKTKMPIVRTATPEIQRWSWGAEASKQRRAGHTIAAFAAAGCLLLNQLAKRVVHHERRVEVSNLWLAAVSTHDPITPRLIVRLLS